MADLFAQYPAARRQLDEEEGHQPVDLLGGEKFEPRMRRTWGEALKDTGYQLAEGAVNIASAPINLFAPASDTAQVLRDTSDDLRAEQSMPMQRKVQQADEAIGAADQDSVISQAAAALKAYGADPALISRLVATNLPSMIPGMGAAKGAQVAARLGGASAAGAALAGGAAASGANAVLNAGGARGEAFDDLKRALLEQGYSEEQANQLALDKSVLPAAVGGLAGAVSGPTGLERVLVGRGLSAGGGKAAAKAVGAELGGELLEEGVPKVATNYQANEYDDRPLQRDMGRTIVETAIASAPGSALAGAGAYANKDASAAAAPTVPHAAPAPVAAPAVAGAAPSTSPALNQVAADAPAQTVSQQIAEKNIDASAPAAINSESSDAVEPAGLDPLHPEGDPLTLGRATASQRMAELELMASTTGLNADQARERLLLTHRLDELEAQENTPYYLESNTSQSTDARAQAATQFAATSMHPDDLPDAGAEIEIEPFSPASARAKTWPQFVTERGFRVEGLRRGTPDWNALQTEWAAVKTHRAGLDSHGSGAVAEPVQEIQNRDRSRPASVVQMQAMANNPDYGRLGISRSPESGAPMVFAEGDQQHAAQALGVQDVAVMSDGQRVAFRYAVMEAADVQPSNFADGAINPQFDAKHPGTVKALNNGRTAGVRAAYERGTADQYKADLISDSASHGIDPAAISAMQAPVLVRLYSEADNRHNMGAKSQSQALGLSASEQAATDAQFMDGSVLDVFDSGSLYGFRNQDFVRSFIGRLMTAGQDVAGMMDAGGKVSPQGVQRLQGALVHKAYGDGDLVETMFGSTDNDVKAIGEALKDVAGEWAHMRHMAQAGATNAQTDITANLLQAIRLVQKSRRDRSALVDLVNQVDIETGTTVDPLTVGMLRMLYGGEHLTRARGRDAVAEGLRQYMTAALATSGGGADMFGEVVTPAQIVSALTGSALPVDNRTPTQATTQEPTHAAAEQPGREQDGQATDGGGQPAGGQLAGGSVVPAGAQESGQPADPAGQAADEDGGSGPGQDAQAGQRQPDSQGAQGSAENGRGTVEPAPLALESYTPGEIEAQQETQAVAQQEAERAEAEAAKADKARKDKADIDARMDASADNFQLGQDPLGSLSGQESIFSSSPESVPANAFSSPDYEDAFDPTQVKSAIGNNGQFDPVNPDIRMRRQEAGSDFDVPAFLKVMHQGKDALEAGKAQAVAKVQQMADAMLSNWVNAPAEVVVAYDMADLRIPAAARRTDLDQRSGGAEGDPGGFYHQGKVYLLASSLPTAADAARVMIHETLGHHGLRGVFGRQLGQVLDQLAQARPDEVQAKLKEYGLADTPENLRVAAEEFLAQMAEKTPNLVFVRRAVAAVRSWLRRNVPGMRKLKMTDADIIQDYILPARRWVEQGVNAAARAGYEKAPSEAAAVRTNAASAHDFASLSRKAMEGVETILNEGDGAGSPAFSRARLAGQSVQVAKGVLQQASDRVRVLTSRKAMDSLIYNWQDRFIDLKRIQEHISAMGGTVSEVSDAYLGEELYHKRVAKRTANFLRDELKPLLQGVNKAEVGVQEFERFLHARHAAEANAAMAERNPDQVTIDGERKTADNQVNGLRQQLQRAMAQGGAVQPVRDALAKALIEKARWDGAEAFHGTEEQRLSLSGMTDIEASNILNGYPTAKRALLDKLGTMVDAINEKTLQELESYGLMDAATLTNWRGAYKHYVPLHRDESHPDSKAHPIGQGFSTKGDAAKQRTGSNEKVTHILSHIAMQREAALTRGEKNNVSKRLYVLATQNPDPELWSLDLPKKKEIDPETGLAHTVTDRGAALKDNVLSVRVGGKDQYVIFNPKNETAVRLGVAMRNLDASELDAVTRAFGKLTRWFASVNTQYNPIFSIFNFARDVQGAMLQLSSTPLKGREAQVLKNVKANIWQIYKELRAQRKSGSMGSGPWATLWEQLQMDGGTTGFRDLYADPKDRADALTKALAHERQGKLRSSPRAVFEWLSDFNETFEGTTRLAVYKTALDQGITRQQAASIAKNITVNFNRRGRHMSKVGSYYAFMNAAIQGNVRMLQTLKGPRGQQIMAGGVALGMVSAMAGHMLMGGGGGADDEWARVPEFVKERSIIIPLSSKDYVSIPMPLGFHVFPNIGRKFMEAALNSNPHRGRMSYMAELALIAANAYNPLGGTENLMQMVAPTPLDPVAALLENKDWTGKAIYKEQRSGLDPKPGHTMAKDSTTGAARAVAEVINSASGGNDWKPGAWSPNPDAIEYLFGQFTGGVGREAAKVGNMARAAATGEELAPHQITLVGRVYGNTRGINGQSSEFYENIKRINVSMAEARGRVELGEDAQAVLKDVPLAPLDDAAAKVEKRVRDLVKARNALQKSGDPGRLEKIEEFNIVIEQAMYALNAAAAERMKRL